jgi:hypothetical protein
VSLKAMPLYIPLASWPDQGGPNLLDTTLRPVASPHALIAPSRDGRNVVSNKFGPP